MKRKVPPIKDYAPIRAGWLRRLGRMANSADNAVPGNRVVGVNLSSFKAERPFFARRQLLVRMIVDAVPESLKEADQNFARTLADDALGNSPGEHNALAQIWDDGPQQWVDDPGRPVFVQTIDLPLRQGTVLVVIETSPGRFAPARVRDTELVRQITTAPDDDGLYLGFVQGFDSDLLEFFDIPQEAGGLVYIVDPNAGLDTGEPKTAQYDDTVTGSVNGSNVVFTLSHAPDPPESLEVFVGGVYQEQGTAFTLNGNQITFSEAPGTGTRILVNYTY